MSRALTIVDTCLCGTDLINNTTPDGRPLLELTPRDPDSGIPLDQCRYVNAHGVLALHPIHNRTCPLTAPTTKTGGAGTHAP